MKFVPDEALLNTILTRYKETHNYSAVARETGLSVAIVKRIVSENTSNISGKTILVFTGNLPTEGEVPPSKNIFYYKLQELTKE